jgi:hypothetical protein
MATVRIWDAGAWIFSQVLVAICPVQPPAFDGIRPNDSQALVAAAAPPPVHIN